MMHPATPWQYQCSTLHLYRYQRMKNMAQHFELRKESIVSELLQPLGFLRQTGGSIKIVQSKDAM